MLGAAFATAASALIVSSITLVEARVLLGVTWMLSQVYRPLVAGAAAAGAAVAWSLWVPDQGLGLHAVGCGLSLAVYFAVLLAFGVRPEDREALMPWRRASAPSTAEAPG